MDWYYAQVTANASAAPFGSPNVFSNYVLLPSEVRGSLADPTLMAIRAWGSFHNISGASPSTPVFVSAGIIAWSDRNDSPEDPPGPITDGDLDWIARWVGFIPAGTATRVDHTSPVIFDLAHLSKAKRRLGNDRGLLFCYQAVSDSSNLLTVGLFDIRMLIKE